jgi:hypothetical protein
MVHRIPLSLFPLWPHAERARAAELDEGRASAGKSLVDTGAIQSLVTTEIIPAARAFKNKLQTIAETLFGAIASLNSSA